jgi:FKBP-type peptidyl-prolyl cis-trans isomerase FklB
MKKTTFGSMGRASGLMLLVALATVVVAQTPAAKAPPVIAPGADPAPPPTPDQISYLFGLTFGMQLHGAGITTEVNVEGMTRGIKAGLAGTQPTAAEQQQMQAFVRGTMQAASVRNQAAATEFLARNGKEKGVITTASGLQYKIVAAGNTKAPAVGPTDKVTVDYRGKLIDGTEFDSSYSRGVPATFPVNGVIKGWQEALVLMKPGAKWQLFIPAALAYGDRSQPKIPGGSLLIFDVNLISAESATAPVAPATATPPKTKP